MRNNSRAISFVILLALFVGGVGGIGLGILRADKISLAYFEAQKPVQATQRGGNPDQAKSQDRINGEIELRLNSNEKWQFDISHQVAEHDRNIATMLSDWRSMKSQLDRLMDLFFWGNSTIIMLLLAIVGFLAAPHFRRKVG